MTAEQTRAFLELIPTAQLYDEWKRRFEHVILSGLTRRPTPEDPEHFVLSCTYLGNPLLCQALAFQVIRRCQNDLEDVAEELDVHDL